MDGAKGELVEGGYRARLAGEALPVIATPRGVAGDRGSMGLGPARLRGRGSDGVWRAMEAKGWSKGRERTPVARIGEEADGGNGTREEQGGDPARNWEGS